MDDKYEADFDKQHVICSSNLLCCAETGRVIAVFYNDYDLEKAIEILNKSPGE